MLGNSANLEWPHVAALGCAFILAFVAAILADRHIDRGVPGDEDET